MPIRTDKIYNKNTNEYIETDYLLKYNPDDKTIRTLLDEILINLNDLENLNVKEVNLLIEEWNKKIDNITKQYEILYNNLSKIDVLENYIDDINKIEEKVNNLENLFNKKLNDLENEINTLKSNCNKKYNDLNNQINNTEKNIIDNFNNKFNNLNNQINNIENQIFQLLNPNINSTANITKKILSLKNIINNLKNANINTRYEYNGFLTQTRGITSKTIKVSRYIFTSGKTYLKYEFTDTETTNYFDLINPVTNESKRFNDCGSSGGSNRTKCEYHNLDLRYLLNGQDGDEIEITFKVYQRDYPGFGYIVMYNEEYPNNIKYLHNNKSKLIDYKSIDEYSNQFQATAVCDMKDDNYPFDNNHILGTGLGGSMIPNLYTSKDDNSPLYFKLPIKLTKGKYEIGSLLFDLESSEKMSKILKINKKIENSNNFILVTDPEKFEYKFNDEKYIYASSFGIINLNEYNKDYIIIKFALTFFDNFNKYSFSKETLIDCNFYDNKMNIFFTFFVNYSNTNGYNINLQVIKNDYNIDISDNILQTKIDKIIYDNKYKKCLIFDVIINIDFFKKYNLKEFFLKSYYDIGRYAVNTNYNPDSSSLIFMNKNFYNIKYFDILQNKFIDNLSERKSESFGLSDENITWFKYQVDIDDNYDDVYLYYYGKYYQILDFYIKKIDESYIKNSDFLPLHSESKLPITWSGTINNNELIAVPNKKFINKDYNSFIEIDNENPAFYKISFDIHLSGSWDGEQYGVKLNDRLIFKDNATQKKYEPFNYVSNIVKFEKYNDKFCSWPSSMTSDNKDVIGHFEITEFFDKNVLLQFFNTLNEDYDNELMNVLNIKIESLPNYKIYKYWNISNFENNSQLSKNNIIKENGGFVVFTDKVKKITENIKLNFGKQYFLRLSVLSINTIDITDKIQININNKNYFNYAISQYDNDKIKKILNKSLIDDKIILCESGVLSNISNNNFKFLNGKYYIRSVIEIPFIANKENNIEIIFNKNENNDNELYALESLIIYEDINNQINPLFTNKIKRIETGYTNDWKVYGTKGLYVDVDTSKYNFSDNVIYFTSLSGTSALWRTTGATSIYNPTKDGFRVYLYCNYDRDNYLNDAKQYKWTLHWIGIEYEN